MSLIPLAFAQPWILLGLLALPALWWLLRLTPPSPKQIVFPPARLLFDIKPKEETPAQTPWWLLALRIAIAALVILAAAGPIWNPREEAAGGSGPVAILMDDGWSAAASWDMRIKAADEIIAAADAAWQPVALIPLSDPARDITLLDAATARAAIRQIAPQPHTIDRALMLPALERWLKTQREASLVWLSDGIHAGDAQALSNAGQFTSGLARIASGHRMAVYQKGTAPALALSGVENNANQMSAKVLRAAPGAALSGTARALDRKGIILGESAFAFAASSSETEVQFDLPSAIRNDIARIDIAGERAAGAVQLIDRRWRRRSVGIVSGAGAEFDQPLLASSFYLSRALAPFADVRSAERIASTTAITQFLDSKMPVIVLADVGAIPKDVSERLKTWIEQGGVLVRFAGPRLATSKDALVPVRLREGGRTLGGALTWEKPQKLTSFSADGPFASLIVPQDVTIIRQVLAEPDEGLAARTWAALADGTPLVTGERRGKGALVLFHVNANTRWSNLPLSGTFVEMLRQVVDLGSVTQTTGEQANARAADLLAPQSALNGFGETMPPPANARPLRGNATLRANAEHPPGFYGAPDSPVAINALAPNDRLSAIDVSPLNAKLMEYRDTEPRDLRGLLLALALVLFAVDALLASFIAGRFGQQIANWRQTSRQRRAALMLIFGGAMAMMLLLAPSVQAQDASDKVKVTSQTRLAYIITGDSEVDEITKAGLSSLTLFLAQRTALEAGEPIGINPARDELSFYPLIYWPVTPNAAPPARETLARVEAYMKQGGTVLFDTRDAIETLPGNDAQAQSPALQSLRGILASLDVPELEPVPREHVLTKTFYLLSEFPGRFNAGRLWVEALPRAQDDDEGEKPARGGDGVSSIIITSNDLAGAWATRPDGRPMLPLTPDEPRQREFAFRAGVNIVMYILTGNYKADQVHAPALIERLGQ
jgi:hypothetical protein